jgi:hypothetical protein
VRACEEEERVAIYEMINLEGVLRRLGKSLFSRENSDMGMRHTPAFAAIVRFRENMNEMEVKRRNDEMMK